MVKRIAQNLLQIHVNPSHILDDNMDYVAKHLNRNKFGLDKPTIYHKPGKELIDQFMLILATKDQRDLAWKFGQHLDGYFEKLYNVLTYNHVILCLFHVLLQNCENKLKSVLGNHGGHEVVHIYQSSNNRYRIFFKVHFHKTMKHYYCHHKILSKTLTPPNDHEKTLNNPKITPFHGPDKTTSPINSSSNHHAAM
ncbi:hypothetical protein RhiirA5_418356 [Rhizophagus irregularis]|uniref:Uncharacterized protein n=1 Tax=Rhizophagus irregularis TaxID=588596 RepID=A0A2N0PKI5_9GLOM|nr:hypothetical protein RhiirA5_418356 [Rhizophagus irregularis]